MTLRALAFSIAMLFVLPVAANNDLTRDAAIGGGIGGALGGAVGAEVGGRQGAIIGSGVGAAVGAAVATDDYDERRGHREVIEEVHVHAYPRHPVGHDMGYHCPPGQRKKGRC